MQETTTRQADLAEIVAALEKRQTLADDFVVPAPTMLVNQAGNLVIRDGGTDGLPYLDFSYEMTNLAHGQLAERLGVPIAYWRRMQADAGLLLAENANYWLARDGRKFLVRTLRGEEGDGLVRAVLSNSYQAVDDLDCLLAVLAGITAAGVEADVKVDLTPSRMVGYVVAEGIAVNAPELLKAYRDPRTGRTGTEFPIVSAGIGFSNSEVGGGAFNLYPRIVFQVCKNGMTRPADGIKTVHVGGKLAEGPVNWAADTQRKNLELITAKARDAVATFLDRPYLEKVIAELQALAGVELTRPAETIEKVAKQLVYTQDQKESILGAFIKGGDTSALGVTHAVTYVAQYEPDGDTAFELENSALRAGELAAALG
jgi:hypothetical protein